MIAVKILCVYIYVYIYIYITEIFRLRLEYGSDFSYFK